MEIVELFFVFVDVHSEPAPVAVRIVVVVVSIESEIKTIKLRSVSKDLIGFSARRFALIRQSFTDDLNKNGV